MRFLVRGAVGALCALAGCLAFGVSVAPAAIVHNYLFQFGEVPASSGAALPGPVTGLNSMTVDSGHVWIAEHMEGTINYRVDKFNAATGEFMFQLVHGGSPEPAYLGVAVGHATGAPEVYLAEYIYGGVGPAVGVYSESGTKQATWTGTGTPAKSFGGEISQVAVDNSGSLTDWAAGDVYVADGGHKAIDVFHPEADGKEKYVTQLTGISPTEEFTHPVQVAVGINGDVLVADNNVVDVFEPTALGEYVFVRQLTGTPRGPFQRSVIALAADPGSGDIYVAEEAGGVVYQFNSAGGFLGSITGTGAPVGTATVDPTTHDVYIGQKEGRSGFVDVFGPSLVVPDVTTGVASSVQPGSVTLHGTVNPVKEGGATCRFVWGTSPVFGEATPCSANVPNGESPVAVSAGITGLQPDTTYYYRLQATNANGTNPGEAFQDQQFTTTGPGIHEVWASNVASTSATLDSKINPDSAPTTYYFQYGTDTGYGTDVPASPGAAIGSGQGDVEVAQHLQGLPAARTYHYRVVAVSELGPGVFEAFYGPDQTFLTEPAASAFVLPDGRAWEMVSPPAKQGAGLLAAPLHEGGIAQAAIDGGAVTYLANAPTEGEPQGNTAPENTQLFSGRGPDGWSTRVIATPHNAPSQIVLGYLTEYVLFSNDLSLGVVEPKGDTPLSAETSETTPYLRHDATCEASPATCYQPLVNAGNTVANAKFGRNPKEGGVRVSGASPDLKHIVIESRVGLTSLPGDEGGGPYEWTAGKLQLVSVLPASEGGVPVKDGGLAGDRHAVSDDGSRIVWKSESHLYVRDVPKSETVRVDVAEAGAPGGGGASIFQTASSDGSRVLFTDTDQLTVDSGGDKSIKLYEFNLETRKLTDLTVDSNPGEEASVQGAILGASEDGSYVYFVADGVLAPGATPGSCIAGNSAPSSTCNLYMRHGGVTTFIVTLSGEDYPAFAQTLWYLTGRVAPNGKWLAFMSDRSLTGYDNRDVSSGVRDEEVFLYDANANQLRCASCNPTGARPAGAFDAEAFPGPLYDRMEAWKKRWLAATVPTWSNRGGAYGVYQTRYLSDSGRLFFNSNDVLTPRDTNGTADVYEYEGEGVGSCTRAAPSFSETSHGCVNLVSSGGSSEESAFVDASENGENVFFLTASQLVPQDYDHSLDMYDARVCTAASPCLTVAPATPPPCSTGDSCKAAPASQPESFGAPSSETFSGAGNVTGAASTTAVRAKSLTRVQKLARALKTCKKRKTAHRRLACERQAKRLYAKKASRKLAVNESLPSRALGRSK